MVQQTPDKFDFSGLSVAERILLVESLWDSIAQDAQAELPLTQAQKEELDRRLAAEAAGELEHYSWPEVKRWLLTGK
jgi:putative addiction module component (TIGR02574 family)